MARLSARERGNEASRRWRAKNPEKAALNAFRSQLKTVYGMTIEEYQEILVKQNLVCAICEAGCITNKRLSVDHCHTTGEIRGLLCHRCNIALGMLDDDVDRAAKLIKYLGEK